MPKLIRSAKAWASYTGVSLSRASPGTPAGPRAVRPIDEGGGFLDDEIPLIGILDLVHDQDCGRSGRVAAEFPVELLWAWLIALSKLFEDFLDARRLHQPGELLGGHGRGLLELAIDQEREGSLLRRLELGQALRLSPRPGQASRKPRPPLSGWWLAKRAGSRIEA